jgi:hypothetical protein
MRTCHIVTLFVYIVYLVIIKHLPILRICRPVMRHTQVYIQQFLPFIMLLHNNDIVIKVSDGEYDCILVYIIPKSQGMYDCKIAL